MGGRLGEGWLSPALLHPHPNLSRPPHRTTPPDRAKEWEDNDIDWDRRTRVFVGTVGVGAFATPSSKGRDKDDEDGGSSSKATAGGDGVSLAQIDATHHFRDRLLLYATRRWALVDKKPPTNALALSLIDFGVVEVQGIDGKTHVEQRRGELGWGGGKGDPP